MLASSVTALVLVLVGWSLLREEQQRTAAAQDRAEQTRQRAEKSEADAARLRAQAQQNFETARRAVDELFTRRDDRASSEDQLRLQLLEEARKFHERQKNERDR